MNFKYIITGYQQKTVVVCTDMLLHEFQAWMDKTSRKIHPDSEVMVWTYGDIEIINPQAMTPMDFVGHNPIRISSY